MKGTKGRDVIVEIDSPELTRELFAALQPTWLRLSGFVLPLVVMACAFRLAGGGREATTTSIVVGLAVAIAVQVVRYSTAAQALRRAVSKRERIALGPDALVRDGVRIAWNEVTDAAEIDTPKPEGEPMRALAVRTGSSWCVLTPLARFKRGDYDTARAIINAARHVRVISV